MEDLFYETHITDVGLPIFFIERNPNFDWIDAEAVDDEIAGIGVACDACRALG